MFRGGRCGDDNVIVPVPSGVKGSNNTRNGDDMIEGVSSRNPYIVLYEDLDLPKEAEILATFRDVDIQGALHLAETYCAIGVAVVYAKDACLVWVKVIGNHATNPISTRNRNMYRMSIYIDEETQAEENLQLLIGGLTSVYYPKNPHITVMDETNIPSTQIKCLASFKATSYFEAISIADAYCSLGVCVIYGTDCDTVWIKELSNCGEPSPHANRISFIMSITTQEMEDMTELDDEDEEDKRRLSAQATADAVNNSNPKVMITPPPMNIVILVVGTRGDVQPFTYFGQALQKDGHRVRLATHAEYRDDVVTKGGLEYYPLAGDPRKLSEYMVKTGGRLMPDLLNKEERKELPEKMHMLKEITFSCFPACTAPDPGDANAKPFLADAIISNPVSYGHIHCAEALSIPLHIMFPQPWSPTKMFPHPLSNMSLNSKWSRKNYLSFKMVDDFTWLGLGSMINHFRKKILHLTPLRSGESAASLLNDNKVPISHMWSPNFVPKCIDWPEYVDVVGEFRPADSGASNFTPPSALVEFLANGDKPLYIGFGSMVIEDGSKLVEQVLKSSQKIGCRILLQSGWTKYGPENSMLSPLVMVIGAMPHDWLFGQVSGVVHHGGAGTTSAGLRAGNPTFICPFFGDQYFWAEMVSRAGVGPKGCRIRDLTADILETSLHILRDASIKAAVKKLGDLMSQENGVANGVRSFYRNLPLANMICEVSVFNGQTSKLAQIFCIDCDLKMCEAAHKVVHRKGGGRDKHEVIPFRCCTWGVVGPSGVLSGLNQGVAIASYELAGGLYDLFAKPIQGAAKKGLVGARDGAIEGVVNFFARPLKGGKIIVEKVFSGAKSTATGGTGGSGGTLVKKSSQVEGNLSSKVMHKVATSSVPILKQYSNTLDPRNLTLSKLQNTLGVAAVSLSGELWGYMRNKGSRSKASSPTSSTRSGAHFGKESLVDATVRQHDEDRVVYDGETGRKRGGVVGPDEIKRFSSDAAAAYIATQEEIGDVSSLSASDQALDAAHKKALHLMQWWKEADKDRDRCIDEDELRKSFPSKDMAKEIIDMLDVDGDRLITFTEISWILCKALSI